MYEYYEFFAGGGMARMGLGSGWDCLLANDFDEKKCRAYRANWGGDHLRSADIRSLQAADLPGQSDLAWASFPCQDLSLAGAGAGLRGERSGTLWAFLALIKTLLREARAPKIIALENVCGALSSRNGEDFSIICKTLKKFGYQVGAVVIDAALFVPQSRPRLFVIAVRADLELPSYLVADGPSEIWHPRALRDAYNKLSAHSKKNWIWWALEAPARRRTQLSDLIEDDPTSVDWHTPEETQKLTSMMSPANLKKLKLAKRFGRRKVGTVYKRTRFDANGVKVQRAEIRFDEVAGCLRTPAGGSSRQLIVVVDKAVRSRLISSRETARLMGLPDDYRLPENYNEAYHLTGDGVVVPVVRHLREQVMEPILLRQLQTRKATA